MTANKGRATRRSDGDAREHDAPEHDAPVDADGGNSTPIPASYEKARDELAAVVAALEEGGLTLDESLTLWERGQALAAACERFLEGARARVEAALARADEPGPADDSDADL
jgi:exodeoxyribonuclease VII small subunit